MQARYALCTLIVVVIFGTEAHAQTAGLEFMTSPVGSWEAEPGKDADDAPNLGATYGVIPWVEADLGAAVGLGGEMIFVWTKNDEVEGDRQLVLSPHARIRMSFPLVKKVTFDGFISVGPSLWVAPDDPEATFGHTELQGSDATKLRSAAADTRFGWGVRFGFGASYAINRTVNLFSHLGYYASTSYGDDVTLEFDTVPLGIGLRAAY